MIISLWKFKKYCKDRINNIQKVDVKLSDLSVFLVTLNIDGSHKFLQENDTKLILE